MSRRAAPVDPATFRRLLGSFATGVTVVTTSGPDGAPIGMTATAVSAVSLEPPLLLVCIERTATVHDALTGAARFALNVLAADQERLSRQFADEVDRRFEGVDWTTGPAGLPLLDHVVAHILCARRETTVTGDHTVMFGEVIGGEAFTRPPLLHFRGGYRSPGLAP